MSRAYALTIILVVVGITPLRSDAAQIGVGDFGGGTQTTTFDGLGLPLFPNFTPLLIDGHTITTDDGIFRYVNIPTLCVANECITNNQDLGFIDIVLGASYARAGAFVSGGTIGWTIRADFFDADDALLGSFNLNNSVSSGPLFGGWEDAGGIARIRFTPLTRNGRVDSLDNLMVEAKLPVVSFAVEADLGNETLNAADVRPADAVDTNSGNLEFSAFPDSPIEDIDAYDVLPNGHIVFSTSTDVSQGFGGLPYLNNGDLIEWAGSHASILFDEEIGFGGADANIDAFAPLPNGNWLLSTDLSATLGGLSFDNGDIVEYDPVNDVATLFMGLDEASIFTGDPQSNADIDALHVLADGRVIFSIRSDGIGQIGNGLTYSMADEPGTDLFALDPMTGDATVFLDGDGLFDGETRNLDAVSLPEPGLLTMLGAGIVALVVLDHRRRRRERLSRV